MRASRYAGLLIAAALGCGEDPKPLTGQAAWATGCPMNACNSAAASLRGAQGSPTTDVECSLTAVSGGYSVFFRIASLSTAGQSFEESLEGLFVRGFLTAPAQELRSASAMDLGFVRARGSGGAWQATGAVGPSSPCHVFIDRLAAGGFIGRIKCDGLRDDATPPNTRFIRGTANAASQEYGEFVFTNCATSEP